MRRYWPCWLIGMLVLAPSPTRAEEEPPTAAPLDLSKLLADPEEVLAEHQREREKLEQMAAAAGTRLEQATAQLALTNWWLAVPTARPATRWVLGLETPADTRAIAQAADAAKGHRERALAILKQESADEGAPISRADRRRLTNAAEILAAFEAIFRAAELPAGEQSRETWWEAGRGLAVTRETEDATLAACALLWQAFAWDQSGRRERALDALPDALAVPERLPYDIISRLMRCRILADAGEYPAAVALTIRIADSMQTWLDRSRSARVAARRLAQVMEHRLLHRWLSQPALATQPAAADNLKGILAEIEKALGDETSIEIYYLDSAIPILVKPPVVKAVDETPTRKTAPATDTQPSAGSTPEEAAEPVPPPPEEPKAATAPKEPVE